MPLLSSTMLKPYWRERNILIFLAVVSFPLLLALAAVYGLLSSRGWALGMIAWFAILLTLAAIRKMASTKDPALSDQQPSPPDYAARKRISRDIRKWKSWIGVLAVILAIGIADGIEHHAWLPTLAGAGMNVTLMYIAVREIRQRRKKLDCTRQ